MDKKTYQEKIMHEWKNQREAGKGLGGLFQRLVKTSAPEWVDHWENMIYNATGFAYQAAKEITEAHNDKDRAKDLESKLAQMAQKVNSEVKDIKPSTNTEDSEK